MRFCDFEGPEIYSDSEPRAKKQHRCEECRAPILVGERHYYYAGKWDGDFSSGRQHTLCLQACVYVRDKIQGGECIPFGGLKEFMAEVNFSSDDRKNPKWARVRAMFSEIRKRERWAKKIRMVAA